MKKYLVMIVSSVAVFNFSGCAPMTPEDRAAWQSVNQTLQQTSYQMNQGYQRPSYDALDMINAQKQQRRDNQTNYQLRQINNNLNGIRYGY